MGAVRVKTTNDRLLEIDYSDTEAVKKIISSWGMVEKLAEGGYSSLSYISRSTDSNRGKYYRVRRK